MPANCIFIYGILATTFFVEGVLAASNALVARQTTGTPTGSSTAPSLTPSPILTFGDLPQAVTCQSLAFLWFYAGPRESLNVFITNVGVSQNDPPPPLSSSSSTSRPNTFTNRAIPTGATETEPSSVSLQIAGGLDPTSLGFTWPVVNVPQGWYIFNASIPTQRYTQVSSNFFVHQGADISCINPTSTTASIPPSTAGGTSPTSQPSPVGGSSSPSSSMKLGAIIGVSVAAVALVAAVLLAWLWLHRQRRIRRASGSNYPPYHTHGRWNGLSSVDSRNALSGGGNSTIYPSHQNNPNPKHQHSQADSVGSMMLTEKGSSAEKHNDLPNDHSSLALSSLPVLHHNQQSHQAVSRAPGAHRTYSASSSTSYSHSGEDRGASPGSRGYASRRPSGPEAASVATSRHSADSITYPPSSPHKSSPQSSSPISPSPVPYHDSGDRSRDRERERDGDATKQANRQSLGGRKRKPVPAYNHKEAPTSPMSPVSPTSPANPLSPGSTNEISAHPDLSHKNSFGPGGIEGKPLHYLIPDMPMPQKD